MQGFFYKPCLHLPLAPNLLHSGGMFTDVNEKNFYITALIFFLSISEILLYTYKKKLLQDFNILFLKVQGSHASGLLK